MIFAFDMTLVNELMSAHLFIFLTFAYFNSCTDFFFTRFISFSSQIIATAFQYGDSFLFVNFFHILLLHHHHPCTKPWVQVQFFLKLASEYRY